MDTYAVNTSYAVSTSGDQALAVLAAFGGTIMLISFVWWLLCVIASWKIFTKAGEPGWKSIIPIYSQYVLTKIAWKPSAFWIGTLCSMGGAALNTAAGAINYPAADGNVSSMWYLLTLAAIVLLILALVYQLRVQIHLAKAYGYGTGFGIGLIFLNPLFMLILGLGQSRYRGPVK